jgi:hypothetical protein
MVFATAHPKSHRPRRRCPLALEWLENRILLAGDTLATATALSFTSLQTAHVAGFLASSQTVDLYQVQLNAGDAIRASVAAQTSGSGLQSLLRVFDGAGRQLALDDQEGGDPRLMFQAPTAGTYYLGISASGNDAYDPTAANSSHGGSTHGLFTLDLRRTAGAPLRADLAGSSFRVATDTAAYGDTLSGTFTVENRGGADAGAFAVQVVLSANNLFGPQSQVLTAFSLPDLGAGQAFSSGNFTVTLPELPTATAAGLPVSGPVDVGLRIDPAGAVTELNPYDQSSVHRGEDWETLTIVTPVVASGNNQSPATADVLNDPNSRASEVLNSGQSNWFQVTIPATGRLMAAVTASSGNPLIPRLTLAEPGGQVLIQSDSAIVQHLPPGTYELSVSAVSGAGAYRLTSEFVQATEPFSPSNPTIFGSPQVLVADLTGDGIPDLITTDYGPADQISVSLGNGDGTFGPPQLVPVGGYGYALTVADVNGDGKPDLVVANFDVGKVSVLLGNGDGTFQSPQSFSVGAFPSTVAVADLTGNGKPDLITGNEGDNTVSVLMGNGDGTFRPQKTYAIGTGPLGGVTLAVADLTGDGIPDIVTANLGTHLGSPTDNNGSLSVLLGNGDGTFEPQQTYAVGLNPSSLVVTDLTGDGKPDITFSNSKPRAGQASLNVLLGNGNGTFRAGQTIADISPSLIGMADLKGDGKPDLIAVGQGVSVLPSNGDGTFQSLKSLATVFDGNSAAVADVNGDGNLDLVVAAYTGIRVLLGNGDGTFQAPQKNTVGSGPTAMVAADLTGDGRPDLVTANVADNTVSVLLGNGDGTFGPQQSFAAGPYPVDSRWRTSMATASQTWLSPMGRAR